MRIVLEVVRQPMFALLEMVIDPACSVVFEAEPEEPDVMRRPPRDPNAPVLSRGSVVFAMLQGLAALLRPNRVLWLLVAAALYWPPAQALFHFGPLHPDDLLACLGGGAILIAVLELAKKNAPEQFSAPGHR